MTDPWHDLWDIVTSEDEEPAVISVSPEDPNIVYLTYSDGSTGTLELRGDSWHFCVDMSICPYDVKARDTF